MAYRSDVGIACGKAVYEKLMECKGYPPHKVYVRPNGTYVLSWEGIVWNEYPFRKETREILDVLDAMDEHDFKEGPLEENILYIYKLLRVGYDDGDIEERSNIWKNNGVSCGIELFYDTVVCIPDDATELNLSGAGPNSFRRQDPEAETREKKLAECVFELTLIANSMIGGLDGRTKDALDYKDVFNEVYDLAREFEFGKDGEHPYEDEGEFLTDIQEFGEKRLGEYFGIKTVPEAGTHESDMAKTARMIKAAREAGTLDEQLPSGTNIPFTFKNGEQNSFDVGRDERHTYLILHDLMKDLYPMNRNPKKTGGWAACDMREHVKKIYDMLPDEFREILIPLQAKQFIRGKEVGFEDMAFLLSATNIFGDDPASQKTEADCGESQIDIFAEPRNRLKFQAGEIRSSWWLRSTSSGHGNLFVFVYDGDGNGYFDHAAWNGGVLVGFCIESRDL